MENSTWGSLSGQVLKENIVLLRKATKTPGQDQVNPLPKESNKNQAEFERQLPIKREAELAECLAFLSGSSDDRNNVKAVCVEEQPDGLSMIIRIAANDGDTKLAQEAFGKISLILEQVAHGGGTGRLGSRRDAILHEVIKLDRERILSRLRSKHAIISIRNRGKPALIERFCEAVIQARSTGRYRPKKEITAIESKAKDMREAFHQLEVRYSAQATAETCDAFLSSLVQSAHSLSSQYKLSKVLDHVPNSGTFGPNAREGILSGIVKLGRYSGSCDLLLNNARKYSIFKRIQVKSVSLPLSHSDSPSAVTECSLTQAMSRLMTVRQQRQIRNSNLTSFAAGRQFTQDLSDYSKDLKIHAEVQILYFYEQQSTLPKPRVVCSSKSACFLCNLFFGCHPDFHLQRTHGVLYRKWTLPDSRVIGLSQRETEKMAAVIELFNLRIEEAIRVALRRPAANPIDRIESVCGTLSITSNGSQASQSTLRAVIRPPPAPPQPAQAERLGTPTRSKQGGSLSESDDEINPHSETDDLQATSADQDVAGDKEQNVYLPQMADIERPERSGKSLSTSTVNRISSSSQSPDASSTSSTATLRNPQETVSDAELEDPGNSVERILPETDAISPMVVSSQMLRLIISQDKCAGTGETVQRVVKIRWIATGAITPDGAQAENGGGWQIIDVDEMAAGVDVTFDCEPEGCAQLWLRCRGETFVLEFGG